jgi:hypothetical protein
MTTPTDHSMIISRFGNRIVRWDAPNVERILTELRNERERQMYRQRYQLPDNDADAASLLSQADKIKAATENKIREVESSA